jgi:hypothetical protein
MMWLIMIVIDVWVSYYFIYNAPEWSHVPIMTTGWVVGIVCTLYLTRGIVGCTDAKEDAEVDAKEDAEVDAKEEN